MGVALRTEGAPVEQAHAALIDAWDRASEEGVTYMGSYEDLLQHAQRISSGQPQRWP